MTAQTKNRRGFWRNLLKRDGDLLTELTRFTGDGWEQEDDITLVTLERSEEL
jgi:hypothetical protein